MPRDPGELRQVAEPLSEVGQAVLDNLASCPARSLKPVPRLCPECGHETTLPETTQESGVASWENEGGSAWGHDEGPWEG